MLWLDLGLLHKRWQVQIIFLKHNIVVTEFSKFNENIYIYVGKTQLFLSLESIAGVDIYTFKYKFKDKTEMVHIHVGHYRAWNNFSMQT